jgi:hypothetical protein
MIRTLRISHRRFCMASESMSAFRRSGTLPAGLSVVLENRY